MSRSVPAGGAGDAQALFESGRYDDALAAASRAAGGRGAAAIANGLLAATIELRLGDARAALRRLERLRAQVSDAAGVEALYAVAKACCGEVAEGKTLLLNAYERAQPPDRADVAYWLARTAFDQRDLREADRWVRAALDEATGIGYARALALSAWIDEARDAYAAAARTFRLALGAMRSASVRDDGLSASILPVVAGFAAELVDDDLVQFLRRSVDDFTWPASASERRFATSLALALARLNEGDVTAALDELDALAPLADASPVFAGALLLEEAEIHRIAGEPFAAGRLFRRASESLERVSWSESSADDRLVLLDVVALAARIDAPAAALWFARASALRSADEERRSVAESERARAMALHARGLAEAVGSEPGAGAAHVAEALDAWDALGYRRRAISAAADLVAMGRAPDAARLKRLASYAPKHPLAAKLLASTGETMQHISTTDAVGGIVLSPAEARVVDALLSGISVKEMAARWDRSEYTIRNHLKRLFAKFGVVSSAALVAKASALRKNG